MRILKTILVLLLGMIIGFLGTIATIVGGGYYIITYVTPEKAEEIVQGFVPEFALPENIPQALLSMTLMEIIQEVIDIAGNLKTMSLNELQERLGYQIPMTFGEDKDISFLFAPIMDIPIAEIPNNMNLIVDGLTMNALIDLGLIGEDALPALPIFMDAETRDQPIMSLFSGLDAFKISDVIDLYTGDYYPNQSGDYVLISCDYIDYDETNPDHKQLTRYKEGYVSDSEGAFVRIDSNYVAYDSATHGSRQRYSPKMLAKFTGDKVMDNAVFEPYNPSTPAHQSLDRYFLPEKTPDVLLAIGAAYINKVPDSDPDGLTISDTINTLQVRDIIDVSGGSAILLALADAYIGNSVPASDPDGKTIPETIDTLQINQVIDVYEEDVYEGGVLIHEKSNQILIAIKDAYIGSNPPPGGLTINDTIGTLQVKDLIEITERHIYDNDGQIIKTRSPEMLIAIMDAYVGNNPPPGGFTISTILETIQINSVVTIYDGTEHVISDSGDYVVEGFIAYNEFDPSHALLERFSYNVEDDRYDYDEDGDLVLNFVDYNPVLHSEYTRYSIAERSTKILHSLKDVYIGSNPPPGGMTINDKLQIMTIGDVVDLYYEDTYYIHPAGSYVLDYVSYDDEDYNHATLTRYEEIAGEYFENPDGDWVIYYVLYNPILHDGLTRYNMHPKSSRGLITMQDTNINTIDTKLSTLTLKDVHTIYDGYEFYLKNNGSFIIDGYENYSALNPFHVHLTRYSYDAVEDEYYLDEDGLFVQYYRTAITPDEDGVTPRYARRAPSSKIMRSLKDTSLSGLGIGLDSLTIGEMIDITDSSPKIMKSFANTSLNNLENTIFTLQLKDIMDIYDKDVYEQDDEGYFVLNGVDYEVYDELNPAHDGLERLNRVIGISSDDKVYEYTPDGLFALVVGAPDSYEPYDELLHDGLPRYNYKAEKSSNIIISVKDTYLYDNGLGISLQDRLNTLSLIDVMGEPAPGTLQEKLSYKSDGITPTLITEIDSRTTEIMIVATLEELATWGIIDTSGYTPEEQDKFDTIKHLTISGFLQYVFTLMP